MSIKKVRKTLERQVQKLERKRQRIPETFFQKMYFMCVIIALVMTRRIKVANMIYHLIDSELLVRGDTFVTSMTGNANFANPLPALADVQTLLDEFGILLTQAASGNHEFVALKNAKREQLMNALAALGNYVEDVANDEANVGVGPVAIIESAGMRPQTQTIPGKRIWEVYRGNVSGTLILTAESVPRAVHFWQYTTTPTEEESWISLTPSTKSKTSIAGLTPGTWVYCRHRTLIHNAYENWEGHDPVLVA